MGEFQAVMHDWTRMCKHFWSGDPNDDCSENCPLMRVWCPMVDKPMMNVDDVDAERLEATVTKWAAEHPEPKYPTWAKWLESMGLIEIRWNGPILASMRIGIDDTDYIPIVKKMLERIPANIAEKLGVEPVEVKHGR